MNNNSRKQSGFTLAEVLITLGIIGVVAAMTLPTLVQNYKKRVVETRLMKFYSVINQAIVRSEVDNGPREYWNDLYDEDRMAFVKKYILPYMKTIKVKTGYEGKPVIYFPDGSILMHTNIANSRDWLFFPDGSKYDDSRNYSRADGIYSFMFFFDPNCSNSGCQNFNSKNFEPYKFAWKGTREDLFTGSYGCSTDYHGYCTALIQLNNWKIPDDYPLKF